MLSLDATDQPRVSEEHIHLGMRLDGLLLPLELVRLPDVIGAAHRYEVPPRLREGGVERRGTAPVGPAHDTNPLAESLQLAGGAIGRSVIDHHDLIGRAGLAEDRLHRLRDPLLRLVGGDDGRDRWS